MVMSIRVNDFRWEPGKNDAEYIKLLESSRDEWERIAKKAISKLKTLSKAQQESRLLTLEEIQHTDAVWLETHGWVDGDVFETVLRRRSDFEDYVTEFATNDDCDITCVNSKIGIEWRCWTSRPSDAQREAEPWEG